MLAASLPQPHAWHHQQPRERRGRSKHVSNVALARQASEERRRAALREEQELEERRRRRAARQQRERTALSCSLPVMSIAGSSPSSPIVVAPAPAPLMRSASESKPSESSPVDIQDEYPCADDPSLTLTDRIQIACTHDNTTLAKMLLYELIRGEPLTDPADPRVETITDADFDAVFAPPPCLVQDAAVVEGRRKEQDEAQVRLQRLRACERIWARESQRVREEKAALAQAREALVAQRRRPTVSRPLPAAGCAPY